MNVPDSARKALLNSDTKKEFIIRFPNGEHEDITNSNLVSESIKLTESVCSDMEFKFGLIEYSKLEFKAIGIGNINGCKISAFFKYDAISESMDIKILNDGITSYTIDASNFEAEDGIYQFNISIIPSISVTSVQIKDDYGEIHFPEYGSNLMFSTKYKPKEVTLFFNKATYRNQLIIRYNKKSPNSLSYGTFIVNSCKKDSNNFEIRDVVAYQDDETGLNEIPFHVINKYSSGVASNIKNRIDLAKYVTECTGNPYYFNVHGVENVLRNEKYNVKSYEIDDYELRILIKSVDLYDFVHVKGNGFFDNLYEFVKAFESDSNIPDIVKPFMIDKIRDNYGATFHMNKPSADTYISLGDYRNEELYIDPLIKLEDATFHYILEWANAYEIYKINGSEKTLVSGYYGYEIYEIIRCESDYFDKMYLYLDRKERKDGFYFVDYDSLPSPRTILEAFYELKGCFLKVNNDRLDEIYLSNFGTMFPRNDLYPDNELYPQSSVVETYDMSMYSRCYYEDDESPLYEYIVADYIPIGESESDKIHLEWPVISEKEDTAYKNYDLSGNYIIQNCALDKSFVESCASLLSKELECVRYMPFNMDAIGLPYVEVGEKIQVLTADGGFTSIVMSRTLSGIQSLRDTIEAN